jgi:hypothetical protein
LGFASNVDQLQIRFGQDSTGLKEIRNKLQLVLKKLEQSQKKSNLSDSKNMALKKALIDQTLDDHFIVKDNSTPDRTVKILNKAVEKMIKHTAKSSTNVSDAFQKNFDVFRYAIANPRIKEQVSASTPLQKAILLETLKQYVSSASDSTACLKSLKEADFLSYFSTEDDHHRDLREAIDKLE